MKPRNVRRKPGFVPVALLLLVFASVILTLSCDRSGSVTDGTGVLSGVIDADTDMTGELVSYTGCKVFEETAYTDDIPPSQSAISWVYDGDGTLDVRHINAAFNCCPAEIYCDISLESRTITFAEKEYLDEPGGCFCLCLYDVDYQITSLPPGKYNIKFEELYLEPGDDLLDFSATLKGSGAEGLYVVDRDHYPWEDPQMPDTAWGEVIGFHGCGIENTNVPVPGDLFNRLVITWEYDASHTLKMGQHNAMINCCLIEHDALIVDFDFSAGEVTIDQTDTLEFVCPCYCAFGLDMEIHDLAPDAYQFVIRDPYYADDFVFTVDLINEPMGYYAPFAGTP